MIRIGVDFGGTKIEAAALDERGAFLSRRRVANPGSYDAAVAAVCELVAEAESRAGTRGTVGIGTPGSVSPRTGLLRNSNSTFLNGRAFREDLEAALGRPVRMANDANCLALSETLDGAAAGARSAFALVLGTGCGGGFVVNGRIVEGAHGIGGEWGHIPLPWAAPEELPGPECWCGQRGCLELWVSGSGLHRDHVARTGDPLAGEAIVEAARGGDAEARITLDAYIDRLGRAIALLVNTVDPDAFVLGGGMSNVEELYERLPDAVRRHVFADAWNGRIVKAKWGDSSGVRGAAQLWASDEA